MSLFTARLTRWMALAALNRPDRTLVAASGGQSRSAGGRTLDPRFQFLEYHARKRAPDGAPTPAAARAQTRMLTTLFGGKAEPGVRWEDASLACADRTVRGRCYRPVDQDAQRPAIVFCHFGGGVVGDLETCHAFCSILSRVVRTAVVSVEYRLAPEHPFPAGLEDALAAYRWVVRFGPERLGVGPQPPVIGGDSMGGNFAAVICQQLKRAGEPQPSLQLLIYPATDMTASGGSMATYADAFPLTEATMRWFLSQYVAQGADLTDFRLSPGLGDLSGLAPALVYGAGFDPLSDQAEHYAAALQAAGGSSRLRLFDRLSHGFTAFTGAVPAADAACRIIAKDVAAALDSQSDRDGSLSAPG